MATILSDTAASGPVGICLPRGVSNVVATVAAASLGRPYVPLPPEFPEARREAMRKSAGCTTTVAENTELASEANGILPTSVSAHPHQAAADMDGMAYVMFTSGSTGRPKGVKIPTVAIKNLANAGRKFASLTQDSVVAHTSNPAFDAATFEIWGPLLNGGTVALPANPLPIFWGPELVELADGRPTALFLTTALFNRMATRTPRGLAGVSTILFGGEQAAPDVVSAFRVIYLGRLVHVYGPTETTTFATAWDVPRNWATSGNGVPVGPPIDGVSIQILDEDGHEVPPGSDGEVTIGGVGVSAGYCDEDAARRLTDDQPRKFRTGDIGRWSTDESGALELVGRCDRQLKIRGFRIEPGEIEVELRRHPGISEAAVFDVGCDATHRLAAALCLDGSCNADQELAALPNRLLETLPSYLVPQHFIVLGELPFNSNGKIEIAKLRRLFDARER